MAYEDNLKDFISAHKEILEAKQNGEDDLQKEFTALKSQAGKVKQDKATTAGEKPANFRKNRYKDILPFDETRFILKTTDASPDGYDYINASYVRGTQEDHAYIAAQGPLPTTVNDFWRLLWESGSNVIIMACNEYEMGKNRNRQHKCERYWAEEGEVKEFDEVSVSLVESDFKKRDYKERLLRAKKGNKEKDFHQFHYTAWPDHGVPDTVSPILELIQKARKLQPNEKTPIIVHCSAGCGRTGTIMVLDYVRELIKQKEIPADFSLFNIIMDMRKQRPAIVQSKDQYEFVHRAVTDLFKQELSSLGLDYGHNYVNVQIGVPPAATKIQPRMPPGLPPTSNKPSVRPISGDRGQVSTEKPTPPAKPDTTVYANAADLQAIANPPPTLGVTAGIPRRSSSRDIQDLNDVQQSLITQAARKSSSSSSSSGSGSSSSSRSDPPRTALRPRKTPPPKKKERHSAGSSPPRPPSRPKVVSHPAPKNATQAASTLDSKYPPVHKPTPNLSFDAIKQNISESLTRVPNGKVVTPPPGRDRPNYTPPKPPPAKVASSPLPVNQDDLQKTRNKLQRTNESDYEDIAITTPPPDPGKSPKCTVKPRNPPPAGKASTRPASDGSTGWKDNTVYQSGVGLTSSDNSLPGNANTVYQCVDPKVHPPPRKPPQSHSYEPVFAPVVLTQNRLSNPVAPSTNSSSDYDLVQFTGNGPHPPKPRPNGTALPAAGDKSGRDKPAQPSEKAKGTLRVIQKLQNTKGTLQNLFSPSDDASNQAVPKPAPPHTNSPMAFPHRIPKPAGPRQKPANSRKPAQVGRGQIGVIPMN
ncbi:uncharacterized protein [Apostichopus japonicus]|uniref:uncharacterized protein isoform X2 n=1 Tax=Stichopus japonicus TaxID=307972 RepID=UPI003AB356B1